MAREVLSCADPMRFPEHGAPRPPIPLSAANASVCVGTQIGASVGVKTGENAALLNRRQHSVSALKLERTSLGQAMHVAGGMFGVEMRAGDPLQVHNQILLKKGRQF